MAHCAIGPTCILCSAALEMNARTCRVQDCDSLVDSSSEAATAQLGVAADFLAGERLKLSAFAADLPSPSSSLTWHGLSDSSRDEASGKPVGLR
jgi:hypothetical protein